MTQYDWLKANEELVKFLRKTRIYLLDVDYIPLYEEYESMVAQGYQRKFINCHLKKKYNCSVRTIYYIVTRMKETINCLDK